ncbi:DUF563 domain-containing protein [soil metagenome]
MAAVIDVSHAVTGDFAPSTPVRENTRVILESGGQLPTATPMLWPTGLDEIDASHPVVGPAPDLEYYVIPNATLSGGGALPKVDSKFVFALSVLPAYVLHFIARDIDSEYWEHENGTRPIRLPLAISILHNNLVFGHWLTEMFPKLLMLKEFLPQFGDIPIVIPSTAPAYVRSIIAETLGNWPVIVYERFEEHVEVGNLIMPSMFHDGYQFHPRFTEVIDRHVAWSRDTLGARWRSLLGRHARKLFVSRRNVVSSFRELDNQAGLEAVAGEFGFQIASPEKLSWRRQVELFSYAECIVGEYGSGMHNTLFSPQGARVVCLNWIVEVQSRIANFRRQSVGYLLPPDGKPRLFAINGAMTRYEIDPDSLRRTLAALALV